MTSRMPRPDQFARSPERITSPSSQEEAHLQAIPPETGPFRSDEAFRAGADEIEDFMSSPRRPLGEPRQQAPRWQPYSESEPFWSSKHPNKFPVRTDVVESEPDVEFSEVKDERSRRLAEELDELERSLSARNHARQRGVVDPGMRRRETGHYTDHLNIPLQALPVEFYRTQSKYDQEFMDDLAAIRKDIPKPEVRAAIEEDRRAAYNARVAHLEERLPRSHAERNLEQIGAYRDARYLARTKGRYPAHQPLEPHREIRRANEQRREAAFRDVYDPESALFDEWTDFQDREERARNERFAQPPAMPPFDRARWYKELEEGFDRERETDRLKLLRDQELSDRDRGPGTKRVLKNEEGIVTRALRGQYPPQTPRYKTDPDHMRPPASSVPTWLEE